MTDVSQMTLKILYTLDNGSSGTYLARSKRPQQVRVACIPSPNSPIEGDAAGMRIGAVDLSMVLEEIYLNSPELLNSSMAKMGFDYNLYYKDICEVDEPLVSLGLLSQIRQSLEKGQAENENDDDNEEEDHFVVTGRVCSNLSALLKRSYSSCSKNSGTNGGSPTSETLELKLRFIKVVTARNVKRPVPPSPKNTAGKMIRPAKPARRPTNPTTAPKAERTQSLPIWNLKPSANGSGFPTNSIAHKIYLADKKTEQEQQNQVPQNALSYQINALQQDNTIQKIKVDDSVSRRFDFMLNKKKKQQQQQQQQQPKAPTPPAKRTSTGAAKARRFNTMATVPIPTDDCRGSTHSKRDSRPRQRAGSAHGSLKPLSDVFQEMLAEEHTKPDASFPVVEDDKENFPPQGLPAGDCQEFDSLDLLHLSDIGLKGDMEWFGGFDPFNSPSLLPNASGVEPIKPQTAVTPRDQNTCNTIPIENGVEEEEEVGVENVDALDDTRGKVPVTSDIDRTSPIDTLSMPLMELNQQPHSRLVSCQEQLKRLPLMGAKHTGKQIGIKEDEIEDDETSIMASYSTPSLEDHSRKHEKSHVITENSSPMPKRGYVDEEECEMDVEMKQCSKKQRTIPSSPTNMFNYQEDMSSTSDTNDLFSSFVHGSHTSHHQGEIDSTPATQYQNQSSDQLK